MVLDESGFGMKMVLDENFWDESAKFIPFWMKLYLTVLPLPTNQVSAIPEQLEIGEMMFGESQPESLLNWIRVRVQHRARDLRDREAMIGSRCVGAVQGGLPNHAGVPCGSMGLGELMTWGCWKCH